MVRFLIKALTPNAGYENSEVQDALFWLRQLLAVVCGIACGVAGAKGLLTFLGFLLATALGGSFWLKYQDIDPEDFPESQSVQSEGLPQSVSLFVLCWVTSYSLAHY